MVDGCVVGVVVVPVTGLKRFTSVGPPPDVKIQNSPPQNAKANALFDWPMGRFVCATI